MERAQATGEPGTARLRTARTDRATTRLPRHPAEHGEAELVLDRYRLLRRLGAGGFGVVWAAFDERLEREVALKEVPRDERDSGRGAEREARAAARLNHPGIVAIYELGADRDAFYLVSELVDGSTLDELARDGALSDRDVARIGIELCDALGHAHARDVIHRDVKPQNVIVAAAPAASARGVPVGGRPAGGGLAKLADFGVAHLAGGEPLTLSGDVVGTLAYMAPEQADGERVTPAADVYSLALTLYEAWTGTNPVRAAGPAATARRLGRRLPPLGRRRRGLPSDLCDVVDAALEPHPADRPPLAELRAALAAAQPELSDEGGLVEPGLLERVADARPLTAVATLVTRRLRRGSAGPPSAAPAPYGAAPAELRAEREGRGRLAARLAAGLAAPAAGALALVALGAWDAGSPPLPPLAAAAGAALLVALLPRAGFLAAGAALAAWLASPAVGLPGAALLLAAALAPLPLLLPRAGTLWSLPALAPLLGAAGLAPAFAALAGLTGGGGAGRRAGLTAAGFAWLALAEVATADALLLGPPDGAKPRGLWEGSATDAAADALLPLVATPALPPLAVAALFAAILPLAVRGRSLTLDLLLGAAWAAGFAAALQALGGALAAEVELAEPRGAVAGAAVGAGVAVAARHLGRRRGERPPDAL